MNRIILSLGLALAVLSCKQEPKAPTVAETLKSYTIEQMMDNESVGGGSFSPDKSKLLVSSNRSGVYNMYTVPAGGGDFTPVTASDSSSVFAISYFPGDNRFLYSADKGGNEIDHIFLMDENGTETDLTPWEEAKSNFFGWARDKQSFFFISNKRNPQFFDLYEMNIE